ncbi:hypothetical protein [Streptomyces iconiensis]|uniref:PAS domain-containing protein n=1 Tax=Streptomyces iconiensis TaxID=1384038 RepID=A0ABT6ZV59_9ACTN|nr:hypothetical protein [Streptomyces iconiensis]MDJ1132699.1 hypothetical protein [Streptomyces iconiensis]
MDSAPDADRGEGILVAVRGCVPSAAVAVDGHGVIGHWSPGARALFGYRAREAVGASAAELLPVAGALNAAARSGDHHWLDGAGDLAGAGHVMAGRARVPGPGAVRGDVLWWAYPLAAPAPFRLLVLATDAARLQRRRSLRGTRVAPGFGPHRWFPEAAELAARLPLMLGGRSGEAGERVAPRVLELGCPVLEVTRMASLPVSPSPVPGGELPLCR